MIIIPPHTASAAIHGAIHGVKWVVENGPQWWNENVEPELKERQREYHNWQEERARRRVQQEYISSKRTLEQASRKAEELGVDLSKVKGSRPGGS